MSATSRPDTCTLYAVYWRAEGVLKVGRGQDDARHKTWIRRGAEVAMLLTDVPVEWERAALDALRGPFLRAFDTEREARWLLGTSYGHTECFIVPAERRLEALALVAAAISRQGDIS